MIVAPCFEGDVDMLLARVQHDVYFADSERRRHTIPWIDRHFERMRRVHGFNHKLLQTHHEHIAAYHRWTMPRIARSLAIQCGTDAYPMDLLESWRGFLSREIPALVSSRDALLAFASLVGRRRRGEGAAQVRHLRRSGVNRRSTCLR